jgi:hypothetical protein
MKLVLILSGQIDDSDGDLAANVWYSVWSNYEYSGDIMINIGCS